MRPTHPPHAITNAPSHPTWLHPGCRIASAVALPRHFCCISRRYALHCCLRSWDGPFRCTSATPSLIACPTHARYHIAPSAPLPTPHLRSSRPPYSSFATPLYSHHLHLHTHSPPRTTSMPGLLCCCCRRWAGLFWWGARVAAVACFCDVAFARNHTSHGLLGCRPRSRSMVTPAPHNAFLSPQRATTHSATQPCRPYTALRNPACHPLVHLRPLVHFCPFGPLCPFRPPSPRSFTFALLLPGPPSPCSFLGPGLLFFLRPRPFAGSVVVAPRAWCVVFCLSCCAPTSGIIGAVAHAPLRTHHMPSEKLQFWSHPSPPTDSSPSYQPIPPPTRDNHRDCILDAQSYATLPPSHSATQPCHRRACSAPHTCTCQVRSCNSGASPSHHRYETTIATASKPLEPPFPHPDIEGPNCDIRP
jgi:hypothetical protein